MTTTPPTEASRAAWDAIAARYDRHVTDRNLLLAERALDRLDLPAGSRLVDVAAGTGALSIAAARRGLRVTAVDLSPSMVDHLQRRARREDLSEIDARVMDGQHLDLDDDTFDAAVSQLGVMLFPDLGRGLREMVRVTRPGGSLMVVGFGGPPPRVEFVGVFMAAIAAVAPDRDLTAGPPPLPFQVSDPDVLRQRMVEAGVAGVEIETIDFPMAYRSGTELWNASCSSNPIGMDLVRGLSDDQRAAVIGRLDDVLRRRAQGGERLLHNAMHIASGRA